MPQESPHFLSAQHLIKWDFAEAVMGEGLKRALPPFPGVHVLLALCASM